MLSTQTQSDPRIAPGDFHPEGSFFDRLDPSFGDASISLRIGPLGMTLEGLSPDQAARLGRQFRPFVDGDGRRPDLRVLLRPAGRDHFLRARRDGTQEVYRMESRRTGGGLMLWSYEFAGRVDASGRNAELALVEPEGGDFDRGLENFLRVLTASSILERGGLLLHASGVVRGGRAHLFFGPSGRGKTTVTLLSPRDIVLSDDLSLVIPRGETFEAAGIPFGLAHHRTPDTAESFPIASLNALVQSHEVRREPITGARGLAEIVASMPFVAQETGQSQRAIEIAGRLVRAVGVHRLHFRKDPSFWPLVEEGR